MAFTAKDVQALRQATGAGMMDAKRALEANDGDMEAAKQWLREKGLAASAKRDERENTQGAVALFLDGNVGAIVELKCETDFVASSEHFKQLATDLATLVALHGETATEQRAKELEDLRITLKEKIELGDVVRIEAGDGHVLESYLHVQGGRGVNAVLVELDGGTPQLAHDVAVHIAFARPKYLEQGRRAGRRRGEGAGDAHRPQPQRGQARAGPPEDRRGPSRRLLQGGRPPRTAVRQGRQADDHPAPRRRHDRALRAGRDRLMADASSDGRQARSPAGSGSC